jgi:hypothetical protein
MELLPADFESDSGESAPSCTKASYAAYCSIFNNFVHYECCMGVQHGAPTDESNMH